MIWLAQNWKLILAAATLLGSFILGFTTGGDRVQRKWDIDIAIHVKEQLAAAEKNQKLLVALEETKNENTKTVNTLRGQLAAVRVQVPSTPCVSPTSGGQDAAAGSRVVPASPQEVFDQFRSGLEFEAYRADEVVEQCRVVVDWAKSLKQD